MLLLLLSLLITDASLLPGDEFCAIATDPRSGFSIVGTTVATEGKDGVCTTPPTCERPKTEGGGEFSGDNFMISYAERNPLDGMVASRNIILMSLGTSALLACAISTPSL